MLQYDVFLQERMHEYYRAQVLAKDDTTSILFFELKLNTTYIHTYLS
jgi:hypothetical protein